jgi:hypothetical protein
MMKLFLDLLKKELSFKWKKEQQRAFKDLKKTLLSTSMLKFSDFTKPFEVHTYASDFAIEWVFM